MNYAQQMAQVANQAIARHPADLGVTDAAAALLAAVADDTVVAGPWGADSCVEWSAPTAGVLNRANYRLLCHTWELNIQGALGRLQDQLLAAGDQSMGEAIEAAADQTATLGEQSQQGTDVSFASLWGSTPTGVKVLLGGLAGLLTLNLIRG